MKTTNRIAFIGILTALNVAFRVFIPFMMNIKPVTSIILLSALTFGFVFGLELSVTTVLMTGMFLGFGPWIPFQIFAWLLITFFTCLLNKVILFKKALLFSIWSFVCGYLYGFLVSLDKLALGMEYFFTYYLAGLSYDTTHAIGNLIFFPICYRILLPIFNRYTHPNGIIR